MHDADCIFCKIATGQIPTSKVYEDERVIAFDDMEPLMPVHVLIIPKDHHRDIVDGVSEETLGHVFGAVKCVADIKGLKNGFRLIVNTGEDASQSVKHFHVHMLGGARMPRPNDQVWTEAPANQPGAESGSAE